MANWYVATTGNDSTGTGAIGAPYATIAKAATRVAAGDTINVADGDYQGSIYLNAVTATTNTVHGTPLAPITLLATNQYGAKIKALSAPAVNSGNQACVEIRANWWIIDGFEITGQNGYSAGAWTIGGVEWRIGCYMTGTNDVLRNCHIHHFWLDTSKQTDSGGAGGIVSEAFYGGSIHTINNNWVHDVGAGSTVADLMQGIYIQTATGTNVYNNLVYNIPNGDALTSYHGANGFNVFNNTFFSAHNGISVAGSQAQVMNNIQVFNNIVRDMVSTGVYTEFDAGTTVGANVHIGYNNVFNCPTSYAMTLGVTHSNDITGSPGFVNYVSSGGGDYHLTASSINVDTGIDTFNSVAAATTDFDGTARPQNSLFDVGAFEFAALTGDGTATGAGTASATSFATNIPVFVPMGARLL